MKRDLGLLETDLFDVVVVGGGVHGACAAMDAAMRGLRVALIERKDFSSETSHNSLKIVHGGLRYFQHFDLRRIRQSIAERKFWLHAAPHMVAPLEFWVPLQGWGTRGAAALWAGMRAHEIIGWDRNVGLVANRELPRGALRSSGAVTESLGDIWGSHPPPAAVWWDGQMLDSDRLVLECVLAAAQHGAVVANYVEARGVEMSGGKAVLAGLVVRDTLTMRDFLIRALNVVIAAGPWTGELAGILDNERVLGRSRRHVRSFNIVTPQKLAGHAVAIGSERESDAVVGKSNRLFFMTPWRNCSVIGTSHEPYQGAPENSGLRADHVYEFVDEVASACPALELSPSEVQYVYAGLTPAGPETSSPTRIRHADVIDHGAVGGTAGMYSIVGIKYTTARSVAQRAIDLVATRCGIAAESRSECVVLPGAQDYNSTEALVARIQTEYTVNENDAEDLAVAYGSRYRNVAELVGGNRDRDAVLDARVRYAAREEMACKIEDIALRRVDWMPRGYLNSERCRRIGRILASELGWDEAEENQNYLSFVQLLRNSVLGPAWLQ